MFRWVPQDAGTCPGTAQTAGALCSEAFASSHGGDAPRIDNLSCQWEASGLHSPRKAGKQALAGPEGSAPVPSPRPFPERRGEAGSLGFRQGLHQLSGEGGKAGFRPQLLNTCLSPTPQGERLPEPHEPSCSSSST